VAAGGSALLGLYRFHALALIFETVLHVEPSRI